MYARLFRRNIRRSLGDYVLYFCTLVISSTLFFAFLSLADDHNDVLRGEGNASLVMFRNLIRYAVLAISVMLVALIRYSNTYMLKQRSREFAVLMILGMEQRRIAAQFFWETFVFGIAAVGAGCVTGTLLSGVLTAFVMRTITGAAEFHFGCYPDTALWTLLFFGGAFLLTGAPGVRRIYRIRPAELMSEKKANEGQTKRKRTYLVSLVLAVVCFAVTGAIVCYFSHIGSRYGGDIPEEISNRYQAAAILAAIAGIFAFYDAAAYVLVMLRRRPAFPYRGIRPVFLGNLFQKLSSTARILAVSTLAITVSLVSFVVLPVSAEIMAGYLRYRMPYDIMIYNTYMYIDEIDDIPRIDYSFVDEILKEHGVTTAEAVAQENYFVWESDFNTVETREYWRDLPRLAMSVSDYNAMREMAGFEPVALAGDQFLMHLDYEMDMEEIVGGIATDRIRLDDGTILTLADPAVRNEPLGTYLFHTDRSVLVFPDAVCERLRLARTCYYANTETAIAYDDCNRIREEIGEAFRERYGYLTDRYEAKYHTDRHYTGFLDPIRFRVQEESDTALTVTGVRLLGIYTGVIFFIICMTVLALHVTADARERRAQYRTLHQIGVERADIVKLVRRLSLCYFFTPCLVAFALALLLIDSFLTRYGYRVYAYIGSDGFRYSVLIPGVLIVLILVCYCGAATDMIGRSLSKIMDLSDSDRIM